MLFTSVTIRFTLSTDGSGATVAGIIPNSLSDCFDNSATFLRNVSFIFVLSILFYVNLFMIGGVIEGGADGGAILRVLGDVETDIVKRF